MRAAVLVFPGSNCDHDCLRAVNDILGQRAEPVWHQERRLEGFDLVIVPGGFSYGDYLRPGAIARFSPVMEAVIRFAAEGGLVLGICNGFQILTEAGLLPGALLRNRSLRFLCQDVYLRVENPDTCFTRQYREGDVIRVPIAHMEGSYYASPAEMDRLRRTKRIVFRYTDPEGRLLPDDARWNPNGSLEGVAGVISEKGNVLGMMPHPERVCEEIIGGADGLLLFRSVLDAVGAGAPS